MTPAFQEPDPTIECPAPITMNNAPGQCSAVVDFAPKVDGMCPDVTSSSDPASGTAFNVGTTNVTSTAASPTFPNAHPMCTFPVTIKDVETPSITCPAPIVVPASSPQGAAVSFAPVAKDNCSATVASIPASGSTFAIGTTTVNSTAQDPSGNEASCSFTVHVKGAAEQTNDLLAAVNGLTLNDGVKNALIVKLNVTLAKLTADDSVAACGSLAAFIEMVNGKSGKEIATSDADSLITQATQIRAVIGC